MNKKRVKEEVVKIQEGVVDDLKKMVDNMRESADIDEEDTIDMEDFSHQEELNDMAQRIAIQLKRAEGELNYVRAISLERQNTITTGSLVETNHYFFYVSIPCHPFEIDGKRVIGLANDAPIFFALKDKKEGDRFTFANNEYEVKSIS